MRPAHPRVLRQPGPIRAERLTTAGTAATATLRLDLAPDTLLRDAVVNPLAAEGIHAAILTLLSGPWAELAYCTGIPDPTGHRVATYAAPRHVTDVLLVAGSATLGQDTEGRPLVHAHASFVDAEGALQGGHLVPELCRTGPAPTRAYVTVVAGFAIQQVADAETNHLIFRPSPGGARHHG